MLEEQRLAGSGQVPLRLAERDVNPQPARAVRRDLGIQPGAAAAALGHREDERFEMQRVDGVVAHHQVTRQEVRGWLEQLLDRGDGVHARAGDEVELVLLAAP